MCHREFANENVRDVIGGNGEVNEIWWIRVKGVGVNEKF